MTTLKYCFKASTKVEYTHTPRGPETPLLGTRLMVVHTHTRECTRIYRSAHRYCKRVAVCNSHKLVTAVERPRHLCSISTAMGFSAHRLSNKGKLYTLRRALTASPQALRHRPLASLLHKPQSLILSIAHKNSVKYISNGTIFLYVTSKETK